MQRQLLPGSTVLRFLVLSEASIKVLLRTIRAWNAYLNLLSVSFALFYFIVVFGGRGYLLVLPLSQYNNISSGFFLLLQVLCTCPGIGLGNTLNGTFLLVDGVDISPHHHYENEAGYTVCKFGGIIVESLCSLLSLILHKKKSVEMMVHVNGGG